MTDTAIAEAKSTALQDVEAALAAKAAALKQGITLAGNYIAVQKNGRFKMPGGEEREELSMVILDYRYRNQFFPKPYVRGEYSEPVCFAVGASDGGMAPMLESPESQHPWCDSCAKNQFGSSLTGGKGKACQNQLVLAVMFPDLGESEEVYLIKASATVIKSTAAHLFNMTEQSGHPIKVISKLTIDSSGDWQKLQVSYDGPNPAFAEHFQHMETAARMLEAPPVKGGPPDDAPSAPAVNSGAARGGKRSE